jgi:hypothetical protein
MTGLRCACAGTNGAGGASRIIAAAVSSRGAEQVGAHDSRTALDRRGDADGLSPIAIEGFVLSLADEDLDWHNRVPVPLAARPSCSTWSATTPTRSVRARWPTGPG